ncbi:MAG: flagellar motor switch protein FliM [Clostridiales bacterium]|jgi:flagellar motor switch protein FliM|nr:flagellar motor switch protein FliM [Clostridiales bacterium]
MSEALSQNQIDELLRRMRTGELEEPRAEDKNKEKIYDFSSPKKFTKDQLNSLSNLYENLSRVLSSYFTSVLRSACEINISQIEEQRYYEFNNALPDNTLVGMMAFQQNEDSYSESTIMLELPTSFGYLIIDRLMGGVGDPYSPDRDYTDIEIALLSLFFNNITDYIQEAWSSFFPLTTTLRSIETNGRLLQAFSPQDIVVIVSIEIKNESFTGTANMCMSAENLENIIRSFSVKYMHSNKHHDPEKEKQKQELIIDYLKHSDLEVTAFLDTCPMSLADIMHLQINDVVILNRRIDEDIIVEVEGIPWFTARIGEAHSKKAIKLVKAIEKEAMKREA